MSPVWATADRRLTGLHACVVRAAPVRACVCAYVRASVCVYVRACVRACVCVWTLLLLSILAFVFERVFFSSVLY